MPPVTTTTTQVQARELSMFDKIKMGAFMGGTVGAVMGMLFGGMTIYQYGPGPSGYMRTMGQYMMGSAATLGLFMSVGSVIRSEGYSGVPHSPQEWQYDFSKRN